EALERAFPGRFAPVLVDPLAGPGSILLLRRVVGLYGPLIRLAPWAWGAIYRASDSTRAAAFLQRTLLRLADRPVAHTVQQVNPAAIVSFHPLTTAPAVRAARTADDRVPVITVVTDLITAHAAWHHAGPDQIVVPSAAIRWTCHLAGVPRGQCSEIGLPVSSRFCGPRLNPTQRSALKKALGVDEGRFLVVVTGGGEGSGAIAKRAAALVDAFDDVQVVAICGRNRRLQQSLASLVNDAGGRLVVKGFVADMADWLRCADAVVTKAGPGTIAEATCCGAPLVITTHLPGQERGNTELVVGAGAARHAPGSKDLLSIIGELRRQPAALEAMRQASASLGRPAAGDEIAAMVARIADPTRCWSLPARPPAGIDKALPARGSRHRRDAWGSHDGVA
ncbi:MAG TPA: glycosyltransferase, partial [Acidimicrobiales bacterium]|nr:glycosyltransferase [Acidimicrobiales bacterium]